MYVCMYVFYKCVCMICPLGSTNKILNVIVDIGVPEVTCQFLSSPVTSATCNMEMTQHM